MDKNGDFDVDGGQASSWGGWLVVRTFPRMDVRVGEILG